MSPPDSGVGPGANSRMEEGSASQLKMAQDQSVGGGKEAVSQRAVDRTFRMLLTDMKDQQGMIEGKGRPS